MARRIKEIEDKNISKEEAIDKEKTEYETMRLNYLKRVREDNVFMALELEKELDLERREREYLRNTMSDAFALSGETNTTLLNIQKELETTNMERE